MLRTLRAHHSPPHVVGQTPATGLLPVWAMFVTAVSADETSGTPTTANSVSETGISVEQLVQQVRPSLAVVSLVGRDGNSQGVGTGFVIDAEGLIATNLHVIGEGRGFEVVLGDGRELEVIGVHASDRHVDLAIVQVKETRLPALRPVSGHETPSVEDVYCALGHRT